MRAKISNVAAADFPRAECRAHVDGFAIQQAEEHMCLSRDVADEDDLRLIAVGDNSTAYCRIGLARGRFYQLVSGSSCQLVLTGELPSQIHCRPYRLDSIPRATCHCLPSPSGAELQAWIQRCNRIIDQILQENNDPF